MGFFTKKTVPVPTPTKEPEQAVTIEPEPAVEVYQDAPEPQTSGKEEVIQEEETDEVAELEKKIQEAKERKKAKEEAEKSKTTENQASEIALDEILKEFNDRISRIEAVLFRLGAR